MVIKMKIEIGKKYTFNTTQSDLTKYNGTEVTILRPLTDKECDIEDVGNMYYVIYKDGSFGDVFEDELSC